MVDNTNVFNICRQILDLFNVTDEQLGNEIPLERARMSRVYNNDDMDREVNYDNETVQFCYIQKYMPFRVKVIDSLLRSDIHALIPGQFENRPPSQNHRLSNLFSEHNEINVLCIGCGPGSEMVGILKYCTENRLNPKMHFDLFDEVDWGNTIDRVTSVFRNLDLELRQNFTDGFDVGLDFNANIQDNENLLDCAKRANLIIFSWVMSDFVRGEDGDNEGRTIIGNIRQLFNSASDGTYFIIVDSYRPKPFNRLQVEYFVKDLSETIRNVNGPFQYKVDEPYNCLGRYLDGTDLPQMGPRPVEALIFVKSTQDPDSRLVNRMLDEYARQNPSADRLS